MTNNNYNVQTDEQIARDILSILSDAPEEPNKEPTESPKGFMLPLRQRSTDSPTPSSTWMTDTREQTSTAPAFRKCSKLWKWDISQP